MAWCFWSKVGVVGLVSAKWMAYDPSRMGHTAYMLLFVFSFFFFLGMDGIM